MGRCLLMGERLVRGRKQSNGARNPSGRRSDYQRASYSGQVAFLRLRISHGGARFALRLRRARTTRDRFLFFSHTSDMKAYSAPVAVLKSSARSSRRFVLNGSISFVRAFLTLAPTRTGHFDCGVKKYLYHVIPSLWSYTGSHKPCIANVLSLFKCFNLEISSLNRFLRFWDFRRNSPRESSISNFVPSIVLAVKIAYWASFIRTMAFIASSTTLSRCADSAAIEPSAANSSSFSKLLEILFIAGNRTSVVPASCASLSLGAWR